MLLLRTSCPVITALVKESLPDVQVVTKKQLWSELQRSDVLVILDSMEEDCLSIIRQVNEQMPVVVIVRDKDEIAKLLEEGADDAVRIDLIPHMLQHTIWSARERRKAKIRTEKFIREETRRAERIRLA